MHQATRVEGGSLHGEVTVRLRDMIVEGELLPGARIPERMLCERFRISRTPLREALKVLASEGLVDLLPNRGARVARLTAEDVQHTFEVLASLEALSGELACRHIDSLELAEIRAVHYRMLVHYEQRDLPGYFALNREIHERILRAAQNPVLAAVYEGLSGRVRRARYLANLSEARWAEAVTEHRWILEALEQRDGPRLARMLREHIQHKCEVVKANFTAEASAADYASHDV